MNSCDGMLTLSEIYKSVSSKYPFYQIGKQVKSPSMICTIKYTLSLNPEFTKCTNQDLGYINKSGKGAYWKFSENQTDESKNPDRKGPKGQLISKCLFGVIVWTKNQRKNYQNFCPIEAKTEILVIFSLVFCPNDDTKKTF